MSATLPEEPAGASKSRESVRPVAAGLFRRLAALFYDVLLVTALLMFATWLVLLLTGGQAIAAQSPRWWMLGYRILLGAVMIAYFGLFWTRGGQTLGMLAWKIRVVRANGARLRWRDVGLRLAAAVLSWLPAGLGYLWVLVDRERLAWHDRLSATRVERIER
jgi:uncharacterized RDD family membrane protein YckC